MSEANLWTRVRKAVGHLGHFDRLEYNPVDGIPDVDFCIDGIEGKVELKYREGAPARARTACYASHPNLREAQEAWIKRRLRNGGRVFILAQIGDYLYLLHGAEAPQFNALTLAEFERRALWQGGPRIDTDEWADLIKTLTRATFAFPKRRRA